MSSPHHASQSTFPSPEELAGRLIAVTVRLQRRLRLSYHVTRLSPARLSALAFIVSEGVCTVGRIAQSEQVTAPTITRILDGLEDGGFVRRRPSREDRRMVEVRATKAGSAALEEARARQVRRLAAELAHLNQADRSQVANAADVLDRLWERQGR